MGSFLVLIPLAPVVHAATPAVDVQSTAQATNTNSAVTGTVAPTFTGELFVMMVQTVDTSTAVCASAVHTTGITYTSAGSWTEVGGTYQCAVKSAGAVTTVDDWYTIATSLAGATATVATSANVNTLQITMVSWTNSKGYTLGSSQTGVCSTFGTCSSTAATGPNGAFAANDIVIGTSMSGGSTAPGGGFTALNWNDGAGAVASCSNAHTALMCLQYQIPTSSGTTNYPSTVTAGGSSWVVLGLDFVSGNGSTPPFGGGCSTATTCTTRNFNATANSGVVIAIEWNSSKTTVSSVSDSLGNIYTQAQYYLGCTNITTCTPGNVVSSGIWYFLTNNALNKINITIRMSASTNSLGYEVYNLAGVTGVACTGFGSSSLTALQIFGPNYCPVLAGQFGIAAIGGLARNTLSAGANFVLTSSIDPNFAAEETTTATSSTSFPATLSGNTVNIDVGVVFSIVPTTAITTIGSCPTKNTATTTLTNNTEYLWTGTYLNLATISNVQTEIASVNSGHVTSQTLYFGLYVTAGVGAVSAQNPLVLQPPSFSKLLTPTAAPQGLTWSAGSSFTAPTGATYAIALLGNSKIVINDSSLSGLFTATTSNAVLAASITSLTGGGPNLFFCATFTFQSVVTSTVLSTITQSATSTTTVTSLQTQVVNQSSPTQLTFWYIPMFFMLVIPGVYLAAGRLLKGNK